jgi:hypothetical protein
MATTRSLTTRSSGDGNDVNPICFRDRTVGIENVKEKFGMTELRREPNLTPPQIFAARWLTARNVITSSFPSSIELNMFTR